MGLFSNGSRTQETTDLLAEINDQIGDGEVNKTQVLDYMLELSDADYEKLLKVAKIYREANRKANDIMGVKETDGEKVAVRVEKKDESSFIETNDNDKKGK